jgi:nucleoside phosphorylase
MPLLYIVVALKAEAQAFVERYKLEKSSLAAFTLYSNSNIRLIISGLGVTNARMATQTLINHFDITDEDRFCNIGICGASRAYEIGAVLEIGSIVYEENLYAFESEKREINCVEEAISEAKHEIVDMESYGFYDAVMHNPAIKNFSIIKVVSDHFEPQSVTKDGAKLLLQKVIDAKPRF